MIEYDLELTKEKTSCWEILPSIFVFWGESREGKFVSRFFAAVHGDAFSSASLSAREYVCRMSTRTWDYRREDPAIRRC